MEILNAFYKNMNKIFSMSQEELIFSKFLIKVLLARKLIMSFNIKRNFSIKKFKIYKKKSKLLYKKIFLNLFKFIKETKKNLKRKIMFLVKKIELKNYIII